MRILELPPERWVDRLNAFTMTHEGWLVSLNVYNPEIGSQHEIARMPLIGVSAESTEAGGAVIVSVARSASAHLTHVIRGVKRIYIEQILDGAEAALLIESAGATRTILQVHAASSPAS